MIHCISHAAPLLEQGIWLGAIWTKTDICVAAFSSHDDKKRKEKKNPVSMFSVACACAMCSLTALWKVQSECDGVSEHRQAN